MSRQTVTKWGFIDLSGKLAIDFQFDHALGFSQGLARVNVGGKIGFIDHQGAFCIHPQFGPATQRFGEGLALAELEAGKCGYIDHAGRFVVAPRYDWGLCFSEGLAVVRDATKKYGYIALNGTEIVSPSFENAEGFSEGVAHVYDGNDWMYIDSQGRRISWLNDGGDGSFAEGVARTYVDRTHALLLLNGTIIEVPNVDWLSAYCRNGRVEFSVKGRYGFVDRLGQVVIQPQYEETSTFSEGLAAVKVNGKYGYIDIAGRMIIPPQFDEANSFSNGVAVVKLQQKHAAIDARGAVLFSTSHRIAFSFWEGLAAVYEDF